MRDADQGSAAFAPTPVDVAEQLARIVGSPQFSRAHKLSEFLTYVVEETLEGRSDRIKALTIAQSVYGRGNEFEPQSDPLIRVEASRLRARLTEYYADVGMNDPVLIEIPKGGYIPQFSDMSEFKLDPDTPEKVEEVQRVGKLVFGVKSLVAAGVSGLAIGVLATWLLFGGGLPQQQQPVSARFTENNEAYAMFLETRALGRPPYIEARVVAALELARATQALDPSFGGGYAAEAFQLWQYVMFGHSKAPDADLKRARELAQKAIKIDPEFGWGYQSLSRALSLLGDIDGAITAAEQAVELSPETAEHWGNLGLMLATSNRTVDAIEALEEALRLSQGNVRIPYRNYLGIAQFHNRQFTAAAKTMQLNREIGGPTGPHMYAYIAAAHAMAGAYGHARAFAELVRSDTSGFLVGVFLQNLVILPDERVFLFSALEKAGLSQDNLGL